MRVQFDLRPASMLEKERKRTSFNITRLLAIVFLLFFVVGSSACVVMMTDHIWGWLGVFASDGALKDRVDALQDAINDLSVRKTQLEAAINRQKAMEKTFTETLRIMQDDLPTLEVLNALENSMEQGMGLNTLRFSPGPPAGGKPTILTIVEATAAQEEQIITMTNGLSVSGVFSSVVMTTSARDDTTGRVRFTLSLIVLPIGEIKLSATR